MEVVSDIEKFETLLENLSEENIFNSFCFSGETLDDYKEKLKKFTESNSSSTVSNKEKKESLEDLVSFISKKTNLFTVYENIKTSTNEIDLLLSLKK